MAQPRSLHVARTLRGIPWWLWALGGAVLMMAFTAGQHIFAWLWIAIGVLAFGSAGFAAKSLGAGKRR